MGSSSGATAGCTGAAEAEEDDADADATGCAACFGGWGGTAEFCACCAPDASSSSLLSLSVARWASSAARFTAVSAASACSCWRRLSERVKTPPCVDSMAGGGGLRLLSVQRVVRNKPKQLVVTQEKGRIADWGRHARCSPSSFLPPPAAPGPAQVPGHSLQHPPALLMKARQRWGERAQIVSNRASAGGREVPGQRAAYLGACLFREWWHR